LAAMQCVVCHEPAGFERPLYATQVKRGKVEKIAHVRCWFKDEGAGRCAREPEASPSAADPRSVDGPSKSTPRPAGSP